MDNFLKKGERIEDLGLNQLKIIQNPDFFCFGMDAVLLSWFVSQRIKGLVHIIDLGTGTGIIPLLLYGKTKAASITGVEIQPPLVEMANRSITLNGLSEKIKIIEGDIKNPGDEMIPNYYDVVVSNPPYMRAKAGLKNNCETKTISRHEVLCNIEDILIFSKRMMKDHGRLFLIHRPERLGDIMSLMRHYKIEVKQLQFIYPSIKKEANLVLIEGRKSGKPGLKTAAPLIVYHEDGQYTPEIYDIYGMKRPE
ncbi:tRNA1(Val) (adenine(37)-N6)-methyltransferase [Acetobacterium woodii]|uniref:Methyltransferase type 11 n=1 Tax=Acetobacterium woodii (strain ATCC 29683 / DSM 1030 / JCM 2381 / KCTC 1655 / WB1) TaxID=931626 RepID=H6LKH0_ACEWD|nr:tRNA1(Val) (adenine(37)-N6)-methyltransferase [Acetobacterium woodii]AFA47560.1 methyltransferase type 11 [Acetobacterium woodii DSM 1030]